MKKLKYISLFIMLLLTLSACTKKEDIDSSENFGVEESESIDIENENSNFKVEDPNFELPTKSIEEIESEVQKDIYVP